MLGSGREQAGVSSSVCARRVRSFHRAGSAASAVPFSLQRTRHQVLRSLDDPRGGDEAHLQIDLPTRTLHSGLKLPGYAA
jgi:hypothetical protein